ncbi:regulator [Oscillatoriales cyanobacterium USR001]|nr:regulator [Oscillatoriales cyanobacterium USR001]
MSESRGLIATILAVDDSAVMQGLVKQALGKEFRVLVTDNAVDALSLIYHEQISVLLLDVSMPGIDGLELCRTVRSLPQFQNLPIVMLTARDGAFDKVQGRLAGATEYLTKPFDAEKLRMVVGKFINI